MDSKAIFDDIFSRVSKGNIISPRGEKVIEVENFMYELPPYVKFQNYDVRKLSFNYIKEELLWYLRYNFRDTSIIQFASIWKNLIQDNGIINSNYGAHLFGYYYGQDSQFSNVIRILTEDKDSRRASMVILSTKHLFLEKDIPCTYALNFRIRNNALNMTVHMRSQDAIFGMGNDAPAFSMIHEMTHCVLKETYSDLVLGTYTHFADSFHVYERHFEMLEKIVSGNAEFTEVVTPPIRNIGEVGFMLTDIHKFYDIGTNSTYLENSRQMQTENQYSKLNPIKVDESYQFSKWLLERGV